MLGGGWSPEACAFFFISHWEAGVMSSCSPDKGALLVAPIATEAGGPIRPYQPQAMALLAPPVSHWAHQGGNKPEQRANTSSLQDRPVSSLRTHLRASPLLHFTTCGSRVREVDEEIDVTPSRLKHSTTFLLRMGAPALVQLWYHHCYCFASV